MEKGAGKRGRKNNLKNHLTYWRQYANMMSRKATNLPKHQKKEGTWQTEKHQRVPA